MTVRETYRQQNAASRARLINLVARLNDDELQQSIDGHWTVGAALAHLAFWDESCTWRWEQFDRTGSFPSLPDDVVELINESSLPAWRALPPDAVKAMVVRAAEVADARTENLSPAALDDVAETGRTFILERFAHRNEHLEQIERLLEP